jgi:RND superfamily putative drug exporter
MATYLYRLGRFAFRRRGLVIAIWLALLGIGIAGAATLSGPTATGFTVPGTESQRAVDLLNERFPQLSADGATARVVLQAPVGQKLSDPANKATVGQLVDRLGTAPDVAQVADPFQAGTISADGRTGFAEVSYKVTADVVTDADRSAVEAAAGSARTAGLTVELGGDAMQAQGQQSATEVIGIGVAAVVLLITFGSLVAAGLPLLAAIVGIGIGTTAITAATGFVDIGSGTPILALMIGLAVSIDYALFIMSRYRHELASGLEPEEAVGRAVGTAGSAVVFAGLTVVIALAGLSVVGIPFLTQMGLGAAFTVVIAVDAAAGPARPGRSTGARWADPVPEDTRPGGRRQADDRAALGQPGDASAGSGSADRRAGPRCDRSARAGPSARVAGRQLRGTCLDPAEGVRPAVRRIRPRVQRPFAGGRRRGERTGSEGLGR